MASAWRGGGGISAAAISWHQRKIGVVIKWHGEKAIA
jgi:hypothetical protein